MIGFFIFCTVMPYYGNADINISPTSIEATIDPGEYETQLTITNEGDAEVEYEVLLEQDNRAIDFDGDNDYIYVGDHSDFDCTSGLTVEAWLKAESLTEDLGFDTIVGKRESGDSSYPGWELKGYQDTGRVALVANINGAKKAITDTVLNPSQWYHIAGTWDGSEMKIYLDGELEDTTTAASSMSTSTEPLLIGAAYFEGSIRTSELFDGQLDEVRILDRALSAQEVEEDFETFNQYPARSGTIAWWHFDENDGEHVYDASGNDFTGSIKGYAQWVDSYQRFHDRENSALDFDSDNDYIDIGDHPDFDGLDGLTVEAWIKAESLTAGTGFDRFVTKSDTESSTSPGWRFQAHQDTGRIAFSSTINGVNEKVISSTTLSPSTWYYITATWDGLYLRIYVDGELEDTQSTGNSMSTNSYNVLIGGMRSDTGSIQESTLFDGQMDEVRILDHALTNQEIEDDYQAFGQYPYRSGAVAWWHFDENEGSMVMDASDNDHTGDISGGGTWVDSFYEKEPRDNAALDFDGSSGYIAVGDHSDFDGTGGLTVEVWIKAEDLTSGTGFDKIVGKRESGDSSYPGWELKGYQDTGRVALVANINGAKKAITDTVLNPSQWYHIAGTWDGSEMKIYLDGELEDTTTAASSMSTSTEPLLIGAAYFEGSIRTSELFDGQMDEVRILDRALTAQEVEDDYLSFGPYPDRSGTIAWWHFDEDSGNRAYDSSGNGYTGYLHDGLYWTDSFISDSSKVSWLTVTPRQGTISPSGQVTLDLVMGNDELDPGTYSTELVIVTDDEAIPDKIVPIELTIRDSPNEAPTAILDSITPSSASPGESVTFTGHGTDPDGTIFAYEWSSDLDGVLSTSDTFSTTTLSTGTHTITFKVKDDDGAWSTEVSGSLTITSDPTLPVATINVINPLQAPKGTTFTLSGGGSDSDGTIVAYQWISSLDGTLGQTAIMSLDTLSMGRHTISFKVQNDKGDWSPPDTEQLWVYTIPMITPVEDIVTYQMLPILFSGQATDEDGAIALYEWDFDGNGVYEWSSQVTGLTTYSYNVPGNYTATFRATDNDGFSSQESFRVQVKVIPTEDETDGIPGFGTLSLIGGIGVAVVVGSFRGRHPRGPVTP